jgi:hypothetical protein
MVLRGLLMLLMRLRGRHGAGSTQLRRGFVWCTQGEDLAGGANVLCARICGSEFALPLAGWRVRIARLSRLANLGILIGTLGPGFHNCPGLAAWFLTRQTGGGQLHPLAVQQAVTFAIAAVRVLHRAYLLILKGVAVEWVLLVFDDNFLGVHRLAVGGGCLLTRRRAWFGERA